MPLDGALLPQTQTPSSPSHCVLRTCCMSCMHKNKDAMVNTLVGCSLKHYLECKAKDPEHTSLCVVLPLWAEAKWNKYIENMQINTATTAPTMGWKQAKRALQKGAKGTLLLVRENEEGRVSITLEEDGTPVYISTAQADPTMVPKDQLDAILTEYKDVFA